MEITIRCGRCDTEFVPDHASYVRGDWRVCPVCRGDPQDVDALETLPPHHGQIKPVYVDSVPNPPEEAA